MGINSGFKGLTKSCSAAQLEIGSSYTHWNIQEDLTDWAAYV